MAVIFIAAWLIGFYGRNFLSYDVDGSFKGDVITLHKNIATTIIFCSLCEFSRAIPILYRNSLTSMSPRMKTLAHAGHLALYCMLIAPTPYRLLDSWSLGYPAPVLYLFNLPALIARKLGGDRHRKTPAYLAFLGSRLYWFGHIAAALKHHFVDKDHVLKSMTQQDK